MCVLKWECSLGDLFNTYHYHILNMSKKSNNFATCRVLGFKLVCKVLFQPDLVFIANGVLVLDRFTYTSAASVQQQVPNVAVLTGSFRRLNGRLRKVKYC